MITGCLIFYLVVDYGLKNSCRFISINLALVAVSAAILSFVSRLPWGIHAAPLVANLMLFGALFGQKKLLEKGTVPTKWNNKGRAHRSGHHCAIHHLPRDLRDRRQLRRVQHQDNEKTLRSSMGEIPIQVPQDRNSDFEPQVVPKYKKNISEIEGKIIAMYARGMSVA